MTRSPVLKNPRALPRREEREVSELRSHRHQLAGGRTSLVTHSPRHRGAGAGLSHSSCGPGLVSRPHPPAAHPSQTLHTSAFGSSATQSLKLNSTRFGEGPEKGATMLQTSLFSSIGVQALIALKPTSFSAGTYFKAAVTNSLSHFTIGCGCAYATAVPRFPVGYHYHTGRQFLSPCHQSPSVTPEAPSKVLRTTTSHQTVPQRRLEQHHSPTFMPRFTRRSTSSAHASWAGSLHRTGKTPR